MHIHSKQTCKGVIIQCYSGQHFVVIPWTWNSLHPALKSWLLADVRSTPPPPHQAKNLPCYGNATQTGKMHLKHTWTVPMTWSFMLFLTITNDFSPLNADKAFIWKALPAFTCCLIHTFVLKQNSKKSVTSWLVHIFLHLQTGSGNSICLLTFKSGKIFQLHYQSREWFALRATKLCSGTPWVSISPMHSLSGNAWMNEYWMLKA